MDDFSPFVWHAQVVQKNLIAETHSLLDANVTMHYLGAELDPDEKILSLTYSENEGYGDSFSDEGSRQSIKELTAPHLSKFIGEKGEEVRDKIGNSHYHLVFKKGTGDPGVQSATTSAGVQVKSFEGASGGEVTDKLLGQVWTIQITVVDGEGESQDKVAEVTHESGVRWYWEQADGVVG